jgi:hypothetical protein
MQCPECSRVNPDTSTRCEGAFPGTRTHREHPTTVTGDTAGLLAWPSSKPWMRGGLSSLDTP